MIRRLAYCIHPFNRSTYHRFLFIFLILGPFCLLAQEATIEEKKQSFRTYPFSDPSPVPEMGKIYPYFRFDGYSADSVRKDWTVVTLENPYIRVDITPEVGGKVWGAVEKSTGKPFVYYNKVVKFRDIAMRGPWTSGGIEFNFGAIGHAPTTSTPVDYLVRENEDGSVSCFVGAMDLASRTEWRVEIRLEPDKAYFETRSYWFNPTEMNTSLYHWMNGSADATDDLRYYFPGTTYIGHGGDAHPWPIHENGRNVSIYGNNDFGSYKSYHVLGEYTDFFGGLYQNQRFGFGHWSPYGDKPGKKIWIWGLSRQGMIWEDLLTDTDLGNRQYTEIQTGLLFNQAGAHSSRSPFKHLFFAPNGVERFGEIWFPVTGMSGMVDANKHGVLNVEIRKHDVLVEICPLRPMEEELILKADGKIVYRNLLHLTSLKTFRDSIRWNPEKAVDVTLGRNLLTYRSDRTETARLNRPVETGEAFDWSSAYGCYIDGAERARQRDHRGALERYLASLEKNAHYLPALAGASEIYYRRMEYEKALDAAKRALALDTYDADANYLYGIVNRKLGRPFDAKDGLGIASRSMKTRTASSVQLAEMAFMERDYASAIVYAERALDYNRYNLSALRVLALCERKQGREREAVKVFDRILGIDPLNHFARFEAYLLDSRPEPLMAFQSMIRNELPHETYLELAIAYFNLGLLDEAARVLEWSPSHPMADLWLAFLHDRVGDAVQSQRHLAKVQVASPYLVYPFRHETAEVLTWALQKKSHCKLWYYLALIHWSRGWDEAAKQYFLDCGDTPDFAPFYLARGNFLRMESVEYAMNDYRRALELDGDSWRCYHFLQNAYSELAQYDQALVYAQKGAETFPKNYILRYAYAEALLHNRRYEDCLSVLKDVQILPHEGARYGRETYRQACVLRALEFIQNQEYSHAGEMIERARLWPENLGVGKPYDVDTRVEDFLEGLCHERMDRPLQAQALYDQILADTEAHPESMNAGLYVAAMVLDRSGRRAEAERLLDGWKAAQPESLPAEWASARFHGRLEEAEAILKNIRTGVQGTPWNPVESDPHFTLVVEAARIVR